MPFIENKGLRISYLLFDESDGEYLFLHAGLNSYKEAWSEMGYITELRKHFKLVLIDPRGHGESEKPRDLKQYTFELMTSDTIALLDHLNIQKTHFMGYSLGGIIGWFMARYHPERLLSLIAGGSNVHIEFPTNPFMRLSFLLEGEVKNEDLPLEEFDFTYMLPQLTIPVLTFVGEKDPSRYPKVEEYSKLIPNITTFTLSGLNHPQTIMAKDRVLPKILEFLSSLER